MIKLTDDAIAFGDGKTVNAGIDDYSSESFASLKKYFYAVMMHGEKTFLYGSNEKPTDPFAFAQALKSYYGKYGKNRAILLISCWTGWAVARPLSRAMNVPVVAGLSVVGFGTNITVAGKKTGSFLEAYDEKQMSAHYNGNANAKGKFRAEWMFIHPGGNFEIIPGGKVLDHHEANVRAQKYVNAK